MSYQTRFLRYGDILEDKTGGSPAQSNHTNENEWPLWKCSSESKQGLDHKHAGSLYAADAQMAIENARDVYTCRKRRDQHLGGGKQHIHASSPDEAESLYDPAEDKVYRHPTFYDLPDAVKHM